MTKIDLNRIADDIRAMAGPNVELLALIAGMFVMLPTTIALMLMTVMDGPPPATMDGLLAAYAANMSANWHILLGRALFAAFGTLAMLSLLLHDNRPTVGESLRAALMLVPGYMVAEFLGGFALALGMLAFVLPGLYLLARLALVSAVAAAEQRANPIDLITRSIALTKGNGWRIFLILAIPYMVTQLASWVAMLFISVLAGLLMPPEFSALAEQIVAGIMTAFVTVVMVLVTAALYRAVEARNDGQFSPR